MTFFNMCWVCLKKVELFTCDHCDHQTCGYRNFHLKKTHYGPGKPILDEVGLMENLQENPIFDGKNHSFL